ncbi:hypothetical protein EBR56_03675 [bacterium]|nr:hypothetical protein [bacterium]
MNRPGKTLDSKTSAVAGGSAVRDWLAAVGACLTIVAGGCDAGAKREAKSAPEAPSVAAPVTAVQNGATSRIEARQPLTDTEWESLRGLAGLEELILHAGVADDTRAEVLATLPDIRRLVLRASPLGDAGFARLAACTTLRDLNVPQAGCTAAGIRALAGLANLWSLRLGGPRLEGAAVGEAVAHLDQLRSLHLIDVPLGDDGLAAISKLPGLWNLYLDGAGVSDEAWAGYFSVHSDVHVHVDQAHHDRDPRRGHD